MAVAAGVIFNMSRGRETGEFLRLAVAGFGRSLAWGSLSEDARGFVDIAELFARGEIDRFDFESVAGDAAADYFGIASYLKIVRSDELPDAEFRIFIWTDFLPVVPTIRREIGRLAAGPAPANSSRPDHPWHVAFQAAVAHADAVMADILRCVVGNPFRPPPHFDSAWRTSTVLGVAAGIDELRTFGNLPVLADALEDAGCDDAAILSHCRATAHHSRGCWVLEGVLRPPTG